MWFFGVLLVCVLFTTVLCEPATPPRHYPGADSENTLQTQPIGGPHVCQNRYHKYCCPGWTFKPRTRLCLIPVCIKPCSGTCVAPNICQCQEDGRAVQCRDQSSQVRQHIPSGGDQPTGRGGGRSCRAICMYGGSCVDGKCVCAPGYTGEFCTEPICSKPCLHGGRCHSPDRCSCVWGYTGQFCEIDHRTGPCYTGVKGALCTYPLEGVVCTRNLCCATVGKAWGHPCEHCPGHMECEQGYLKNIRSGECVDIDECDAIPGLCAGGKCVNTLGSFICECPEGKARNPDTNRCDDRNECLEEGICLDGRCVNTEPGFYCLCNPGFIQSQDRASCIDGRQGHCYTTRTRTGYCRNPLHMKLSKKDCCCGVNMGQGWGDDCMRCPIHGEDEHRILCAGGKGIIHIDSETSTKDIDGKKKPVSFIKINECILRPGICGAGECIDTPEGYECRCKPGHRLNRDQVCEDIDECREGKCQGGHCTNSPGSFTCVCPPGFDVSPDGTRCTDHDECAEIGMCTNGICINMDGSFKCHCKPGFKLSPTGHACIDIDECYENPRICLNGNCENTPGSYSCRCQPGFTISNDGTFCIDLDECSNTGMCENGKCVNIEGSFKCVCDPGYRLGSDGRGCIDIDECISNPCQHGKCFNSPGSFRCECHPGFNLGPDGRSCLDTRRDLCYSQYRDGQCFNPTTIAVTKSSCCCCTIIFGQPMGWGTNCQACPMPGTSDFDRLCPHGPGMTYNGDDINECAQNPNICQNGACENMIGTHRCICNPGYQVDENGKICSDINECEIDDLMCSGGQCRNTPGSFQCICPTGTHLNPRTHECEDIDECEDLGPEACFNGDCVNVFGSYKCECDPGSILDNTGRVCIDNRKGSCWTRLIRGQCENNLPRLSLRSECCCSIGLAWGSPCEVCKSHECNCPRGYAKVDGKTCTDINECDLNPDICRGGTCVNTDGSFTCTCPPGLTLDVTKTHCLDIRQEQCYTRYKHGQCSGALEGFFYKNLCCCSPVGKAWGGDRCEPCPRPGTPAFQELCPKGEGFLDKKDINECTEFPGLCGNGRCKNSIGSFSCRCNKGYALDEFKIRCIDIDECTILHGVCGNGNCRNVPGDFVCDCTKGYRTTNMMQVCMDINECEEIPGLCRGGRCINSEGSYKCVCPAGHELAPDKQSCKDIDECSRTSGICSNGVCENMMGTYQCVCNDGYQQTGLKSHCKDIDECEDDNAGCDDVCMNTPGSYSCACGDGFSLLLDGRTCTDVDECNENTRICNGGQCENTVGSFACVCTDGLTPAAGGTSCLDIDECTLKKDICGNGDCVNNLGSFQCRCEDGYSVKPEESAACTDDDECFLETHNCHINADCINIPGSFQCRCEDGFTGNGVNCRDINECLTNNGGCDQNAQCINIEGSFKCLCDSGFKGDGYSCIDIDECSNDPSLCENGQCLNYPGSFRCECEMGFMHPDDKNDRNDQSCIDINECQMFTNLCVFGRCENIFGMFRCECNDGYKLDGSGGNCTDIDECESPQSCLYGKCTNTQGSYICECPPNYELVSAGNACIDRRTSRCYLAIDSRGRCHADTSDYVTKASCCCSVGQAWGPHCEKCPRRDSPEYQELCPGGMGYRPNDITVVLEDINECEEHENLCKNGHCTNTFGSFMCSCNEGFRLDNTGAMCVDINECVEIPNICSIGHCVNEEGKYHCVCPDGYMPMPGGKECVDMRKDICYLHYSRYGCSTPMSQNTTRKLCCCSMGQGWGQPCKQCPVQGTNEYYSLCGQRPGQIINPMTNETEEIDECVLMPTMCTHGQCMNTPGSFECQCNRGYIYDVNSHQCIDDNECLKVPSPCQGNAQCINLPGYFECKCPEGYKHGLTHRDCIDIDECNERPNICQNGLCKNLQGSFQCVCHPGYLLTPSRDTCLDVDECIRHPNICNNGTCVNQVGSYKCHCYPGFKLSPNNDCIDVDECHMMPFLCRNGRCRNTIGSFNCECATGYILSADGQHCRDIDECVEKTHMCPSPGKCQNLMGSFICSCPEGFELSPITNICEDIDECLINPGICENGVCTNTIGGAFCTCPEGYILSPGNMKCVDMRKEQCYDQMFRGQCSKPRGMVITAKECCCSKGVGWGRYCQECPRDGTAEFAKLCPEGAGRMDSGEDLNECLFMPDACSGGDCINTDGSFRCECPMGYVLDPTGKKCVDENECLTSQNICGNGTCSNIDGGFECSCNEGFAPGPMQVCEDINECHEFGNQCAFRCHNVPGSYRCICPYGYALAQDGKHCIDVDECATPANNCKFLCKNLIGSFMCICPEGYTQIGMSDDCRDINECAINSGLCQNGRCMNLQGSYRCDCFEGFEPSHDRKSCIDRRLGFCFRQLVHGRCTSHTSDMKRVTRASCCCTMGEAWGPRCEICPPKYSEEYQAMCLESGISVDGQDIDECATMPDLCKNGRCINTMGSYRCICNRGFKPDHSGTYCIDINECQQSPIPCKFSCQNTAGSFICSCPAGYILNPDGVSCRDIDECATGNHVCQHECINTQGSYKCACPDGYNQIGDKCQDINECSEDNLGICPKPGKCINTLGSFRCICPRGYKLDSTKSFCLDQDECLDDTRCTHGCLNLLGRYKCSCPEGYIPHEVYTNQCKDENECMMSPCGDSGSCVNTIGSYRCGCPDGYQFDGSMKICIQISSGCAGAPCVFGCTAMGSGGFICGCPQGYQRVGQGHCLSTITPMGHTPGYGQDIGNVPVFPIEGEQKLDDKVVATEGCFSCKINGRHRRDSKQRQKSREVTNHYEEVLHRLLKRSPVWHHKRRHHHGEEYLLTISLAQTKHRMRIIKIQPAVKRDMEYTIAKGNENNKFELVKKHGVWALHFRRRMKHEGAFDIVIHGRPANYSVSSENETWDKPLTLPVRLIVTE